MTSKESPLDNLTEKDIQNNLETGILMAIQEKKEVLNQQIKDLSKKELIRLIKNAANFPQPVPTTGAAEIAATETLYTIKDLQVEMSLITLGKLQEEQENKGEENE